MTAHPGARWSRSPVLLVLAGLAVLPADTRPDLYVLAVPLARDNDPMALLAFIGGFSAATAMVVAETIALSTMATNDQLAPLLLRRHGEGAAGAEPAHALVQRLAVAVVQVE